MSESDDEYINGVYDEYDEYEKDKDCIKWEKQIRALEKKIKKAKEQYDKKVEEYEVQIGQLKQLKIFKILKPTVKYICLSENHLIMLPDCSKFTRVETLDVSMNNLTSVPDNLPNTILYLDFSENLLDNLPDKLPNKLQKLYCQYNCLKYLPENLPHSLEIINCSNNHLEYLPTILPANLQVFIVNPVDYIRDIYKLYNTKGFKLKTKYNSPIEIEDLRNHIFHINVIKRIGNNTNKMALLNANGALLENWAKITGKPSCLNYDKV